MALLKQGFNSEIAIRQ